MSGGNPDRQSENLEWDSPVTDSELPDGERLQKVLARAGVASRRVIENFIVEGRIRVNGKVVTELGRRVNPEQDLIDVDGIAVQLNPDMRYVVLNKPTGVYSTMKDEHDRPDLRTFAEQWEERLYNVGRLDSDTSGLLILTNDGDLAHVLAHPSYEVSKVYFARVRGVMRPDALAALRRGIELEDGPIKADRARILDSDRRGSGSTLIELALHSGRNRIVRRMLAAVGHPVLDLVRRQFGPLRLGDLPVGQMRELTTIERGALLTLSRQHSGSGASTQPQEKP